MPSYGMWQKDLVHSGTINFQILTQRHTINFTQPSWYVDAMTLFLWDNDEVML